MGKFFAVIIALAALRGLWTWLRRGRRDDAVPREGRVTWIGRAKQYASMSREERTDAQEAMRHDLADVAERLEAVRKEIGGGDRR